MTLKTAIVKLSSVSAAPWRRLDAPYHIAIKTHLEERGLEETPENVKSAHEVLRGLDVSKLGVARRLRDRAKRLEEKARKLENDAVSFPNGRIPKTSN